MLDCLGSGHEGESEGQVVVDHGPALTLLRMGLDVVVLLDLGSVGGVSSTQLDQLYQAGLMW